MNFRELPFAPLVNFLPGCLCRVAAKKNVACSYSDQQHITQRIWVRVGIVVILMIEGCPNFYAVRRPEVICVTSLQAQHSWISTRAPAQCQIRMPVLNIVVHLTCLQCVQILFDAMMRVPEICDSDAFFKKPVDTSHMVHIRMALNVSEN